MPRAAVVMIVGAVVWMCGVIALANGQEVFPQVMVDQLTYAPCFDSQVFDDVVHSPDMSDRRGDVLVDIPYPIFLKYFLQPNLFPTWDTDYSVVYMTEWNQCAIFNGTFTTHIDITPPAGFDFFSPLIWQVNITESATTIGWYFDVHNPTTNEYFYKGAHFFYLGHVNNNGRDTTHFISWEKIFGTPVVENPAVFADGLTQTVLKPDIDGAMCLQHVFLTTGQLVPEQVQTICNPNLPVQ